MPLIQILSALITPVVALLDSIEDATRAASSCRRHRSLSNAANRRHSKLDLRWSEAVYLLPTQKLSTKASITIVLSRSIECPWR